MKSRHDTTRGQGVRFTPPPLAARLAKGLLGGSHGSKTPRILDPACGEGELLLAAWEASGRDARLACGGLFGIEVDPETVTRARDRLRRTIGGEAGESAARHVRVGDALDPATDWPAATSVVANPPWVSFSGREAGSLPKTLLDRYRRAWPTIRGWPSLHGAFLERIARHTAREGTRARLLLPASVCDLAAYAETRRLVTSRCVLEGPPRELGEDAFVGVVEPAVLVGLQPAPRRSRGTDAPWSALDPAAEAWVDHLAAFPTLPAASFGDFGVHSGNCARELIFREPARGRPGIREGRDLVPFRLAPPRAWLETGLERGAERRFRIAPLERQAAVPVLLRQTANRPIAARHVAPGYFRNSLLACTPPAELDSAFVVAVLNSEVAARWHRLLFRDARQRAFPQVKVSHLRSQRFPFLARAEHPSLHDEVVELSNRLAKTPDAAGEARIEELVREAFRLPSPEETNVGALATIGERSEPES